ncbi:hypothetical protein ASD50_18325 [Mesorhizobium sp. Root552]|uniref:hypothetical protein n=1 Tax=Mesorhizobium sp. Root552 TaxID=1736555 RepID=UPI0006FD9DEC|nr:hypothetical protein [Mesorhizobium sp. Root552]KQZ29148.1 hypothetical protein ASD50_18325 [Mesorhizobium sp. Root552]
MNAAQLDTYVAAVEAAIADLRRYIGGQPEAMPAPQTPTVSEPERRANLIGVEWIETSVAAQRFEVSKERIQSWCQRYDDFGWKRGGRWYVSVTKMREKLGTA